MNFTRGLIGIAVLGGLIAVFIGYCSETYEFCSEYHLTCWQSDQKILDESIVANTLSCYGSRGDVSCYAYSNDCITGTDFTMKGADWCIIRKKDKDTELSFNEGEF